MKRNIIFITLLLITISVFSQNSDDIIIENLIQTSGIKNQYNSNACWSFSSTSFLEAELKRMHNIGIELSPMYFIYYNYVLQAENYLDKNGNARFSPGGLACHALDVYDKSGFVPYDVYEANFSAERYDYQSVFFPIKNILDSALTKSYNRNEVLALVKKTLDKNIAPIPDSFEYNDKVYKTNEFADKIGKINIKDYYSFTSYEDFEFYKKCDLPVSANWKNETYYNLPLEEFIELVNYSLKNGFTLLWDGDVTEYPIITDQGINFKVKKVDLFQFPNDTTITDDLRQKTFNDKTTTEDHNSHIVGIATAKNGNKYYILKDSNGQDNFSKGFIYISENYLALKTISVIVHKEGVPDKIKNKLITDE